MKNLKTTLTNSRVQSFLNKAGTFQALSYARSTLCVGVVALISAFPASAQDVVVNVNVLDIQANDIAYSDANNALYATTPSSIGFPYGNSVLTLDPLTGAILDNEFAGSEPNQIAISSDGSRAYIGIDGARAFRSWTPGTSDFGQLLPLLSTFGDPAIANALAVVPGDASTVVVSKDEVGSSASGDLELFENDVSLGDAGNFFDDADQIVFVDNQTLVSYNDSSTGFDLIRWSYNQATGTLVPEAEIGGLVAGFSTQIEAEGGLIYASNGIVVDPATLTALGTFTTGLSNAVVESVDELDMTFFLGEEGFSGPLNFVAYDNDTFLEIYRVEVDLGLTGFDDVEDLVYLGGMNFAFLSEEGVVGIISAPVPLPAGLVLLLSALGVLGLSKKSRI